MKPAYIQAELKIAGYTQKSIAKELGVAADTVSKVIRKKLISDRVMRGVAERIGRPVQIVFPEYYQAPPKRKTSKVIGNNAGQ